MTEDEPKPKSTLKIVLIVFLAVGIPVVCGVICCGGLGIWGWSMVKDLPEAITNAKLFMTGLSSNQIDPTYQATSSGFKSTTSLEQFREYVTKYPVLLTSNHISMGSVRVLQQMGPKKAVINIFASNPDNSVSCTMTLVQENDVWKVDGFTVP